MLSPNEIRQKIEWEGWPDAIEWLDAEDVEDETLKGALQSASDAYLDLEAARDTLYARLDELLEEDSE
jgi:hypothetical protein